MYNYEAVAVYLWRHRWKPDDLFLMHEFEQRLHYRAQHVGFEITDSNTDDREGMELLLERINDIARRLQFESIKKMRLMALVSNDSIKSRMASAQTASASVLP